MPRDFLTGLWYGLVALLLPGLGVAGGGVPAVDVASLFSPELYRAVEREYGLAARQRIEAWERLLKQLPAEAGRDELGASRRANAFFNRVPWLTDREHWGLEDYWATPIETLASNGGDCEDYAIGKYFSLSASGVGDSKLRITYVEALELNQAHMVLAYYPQPEAEPLILDNIRHSVLPASQRPDLRPIYSFNGEGLWLAGAGPRALEGGDAGLPQWRGLVARLRAGFSADQ